MSGQALEPRGWRPGILVEDRDSFGAREIGTKQARGVGKYGDPRVGPALVYPVEGDGEHGQVAVVAQPVLAVLDQNAQRPGGLRGALLRCLVLTHATP